MAQPATVSSHANPHTLHTLTSYDHILFLTTPPQLKVLIPILISPPSASPSASASPTNIRLRLLPLPHTVFPTITLAYRLSGPRLLVQLTAPEIASLGLGLRGQSSANRELEDAARAGVQVKWSPDGDTVRRAVFGGRCPCDGCVDGFVPLGPCPLEREFGRWWERRAPVPLDLRVMFGRRVCGVCVGEEVAEVDERFLNVSLPFLQLVCFAVLLISTFLTVHYELWALVGFADVFIRTGTPVRRRKKSSTASGS